MNTKKRFHAVLEPDHTKLHWVIAKVPFDPTLVWPERSGMRIKGTINSFPFRTSLFGTSDGGHLLLVNKQMQKGAQTSTGGLVEIVLEPDLEERIAAVPSELAKLLKNDRSLKQWFKGLSYSMRKYISDTISAPKSADVRLRRAEQAAEWMMLAMEGERTLPPILQAAFRQQPQARTGWDAMTAVQRRGHLLGIFYYQGPEARQKRTQKAVAEMLKLAKRTVE